MRQLMTGWGLMNMDKVCLSFVSRFRLLRQRKKMFTLTSCVSTRTQQDLWKDHRHFTNYCLTRVLVWIVFQITCILVFWPLQLSSTTWFFKNKLMKPTFLSMFRVRSTSRPTMRINFMRYRSIMYLWYSCCHCWLSTWDRLQLCCLKRKKKSRRRWKLWGWTFLCTIWLGSWGTLYASLLSAL